VRRIPSAIKKLLKDWGVPHRAEDAGEGVFIVMKQQLPRRLEKEVVTEARKHFMDVQWCPDPDSHGRDAYAVLNCFYPVRRKPARKRRKKRR